MTEPKKKTYYVEYQFLYKAQTIAWGNIEFECYKFNQEAVRCFKEQILEANKNEISQEVNTKSRYFYISASFNLIDE